ncbi:mitochondrial carrier protein, tricarboxylate/iron carrier [Rhodotorula toruloides NP11]|uniref:Mitochondrial carrier protein, tricarboxylate/iron carrier n=1 Tax=Rhodotorula toruloides (strain NP11) TaxID=1130832 RepID=M7WKT8_RHOT1|nr:mitochondrial carrier protein, tricarboxylate/iron carrier [Rhodotorula toruloides NP11]EMS18450.1 mitochondrial carrier protein, tricarboxylate/iron carrier [Rhodotorula toruloides NP11]
MPRRRSWRRTGGTSRLCRLHRRVRRREEGSQRRCRLEDDLHRCLQRRRDAPHPRLAPLFFVASVSVRPPRRQHPASLRPVHPLRPLLIHFLPLLLVDSRQALDGAKTTSPCSQSEGVVGPKACAAASEKGAQRSPKEHQEKAGRDEKGWALENQYRVWRAKPRPAHKRRLFDPPRFTPASPSLSPSASPPSSRPTSVIFAGMLAPNPSLKSVIFWQWANQSLNVCVNYSNANKSIKMSTSEIASAYAAATVASCSIAVGLPQLVPRLRVSPSARALLSKLVPFAAVASAGCVNIGLMRWKEMRDGISVFKPSDPKTGRPSSEELGKSSIAGAYAVGQTAARRVLTNITRHPHPPAHHHDAPRERGIFNRPNGRRLNTVTHIGLIGLSILVFLPPAIAAFPSRASISPKKLEERFHEVLFEEVEFNKGL